MSENRWRSNQRLINHSRSIDTFGQLLKWSLMQRTSILSFSSSVSLYSTICCLLFCVPEDRGSTGVSLSGRDTRHSICRGMQSLLLKDNLVETIHQADNPSGEQLPDIPACRGCGFGSRPIERQQREG